ncbi:MAG: hypothetical protein QM605_03010 [Sphingobium sp.]
MPFVEQPSSGTISNTPADKVSQETLAILDQHEASMRSNDPDTIAADYSEDVILLLSFVPKPIIGKAAQKAFLVELFGAAKGKSVFDVVLKDIGGTPSQPRMLRREAVGNYAYLIADLGIAILTETYVMRDGKIVFESVTVSPKPAAEK